MGVRGAIDFRMDSGWVLVGLVGGLTGGWFIAMEYMSKMFVGDMEKKFVRVEGSKGRVGELRDSVEKLKEMPEMEELTAGERWGEGVGKEGGKAEGRRRGAR